MPRIRRPLKVTRVVMTCFAAPFQLEGITDDGRPVYVRARHGELRVSIGPTGGDIFSAVEGEEVFYKDPCNWEDETYPGLKRLTRGLINWPRRLSRRRMR